MRSARFPRGAPAAPILWYKGMPSSRRGGGASYLTRQPRLAATVGRPDALRSADRTP
jgi:hypothetical protein